MIKNFLDSGKKSTTDAIKAASKREIQKPAEITGDLIGNKIAGKMLKSSMCDYGDAYILVKGTITITGAGDNAAAKQADERNKDVIFKNWNR